MMMYLSVGLISVYTYSTIYIEEAVPFAVHMREYSDTHVEICSVVYIECKQHHIQCDRSTAAKIKELHSLWPPTWKTLLRCVLQLMKIPVFIVLLR